MTNDEQRCWLALVRLNFISHNRLTRLLARLHDITEIFSAPINLLQDIAGLSHDQASLIKTFDFNTLKPDLTWLDHDRHYFLTIDDPYYPTLLKKISQAPIALYVKGDLSAFNSPGFAIVGSRKPTPMGKENAYKFANLLANLGFSIVSGLAHGVDTASHEAAYPVGKTIAVMGTGIDIIYPKQNKKLAEELINTGLLVSEFALGSQPMRENFPKRNRVISGLSLGVLIVEAALQSGSLITAKYALEQNREIFAIPGSIHNPQSKGCHWLIKQGATLVEKVDDIIAELGGLLKWSENKQEKEKLAFPDLDEDDSVVLRAIRDEPITLDAMTHQTGFTLDKIAYHLLRLELKGYVQSATGGYVKLKSE